MVENQYPIGVLTRLRHVTPGYGYNQRSHPAQTPRSGWLIRSDRLSPVLGKLTCRELLM